MEIKMDFSKLEKRAFGANIFTIFIITVYGVLIVIPKLLGWLRRR